MTHIFISYSHADTPYVSNLTAELEKRGFSVWLDERILQGGERWFSDISKAIASCVAMIVVMTPDAEQSEWVEREIMLALKHGKQIFPLLLVGQCFDILISRQFTNVSDGNLPSNQFYDLLLKAIEEAPATKKEQLDDQKIHEVNAKLNSTPRISFSENMYYSDAYTFQEHLVELLEHQNKFGFRRYIREAPQIFFSHIQNLPNGNTEIIQQLMDEKLKQILDNLMVIGITAIEYDFYELFEELVQAFHTIFVRAYGFGFPKLSDAGFHFSVSWIWHEVIKRVYVLGSVLIKHRKFSWIRYIVRQEVTWDNYYKKFYWSRYISISLALENRLPEKSLCISVVGFMKNSKYLASIFFGNEDLIISTICQFDFLQAVNVLQEGKDPYPNFGAYYKHHTEPIISGLIEQSSIRDTIGYASNHDLAQYIRFLDHLAGTEFFTGAWHRNSWSDSSITEFLEKNFDG